MSKNARQTFINALNRNYHFTKSEAFKEKSSEYLNEWWELLKQTYVGFLEQHNILVERERPDKLKEHQDLATQMEDIYVETVTAFRKRSAELEAIELANRMEQKAGAANAKERRQATTSAVQATITKPNPI